MINNMTLEQLQGFKSKGLQTSFTHPSFSRYREKETMLQHMQAEYPAAQLLNLSRSAQLNQYSKTGFGSTMNVVVYKLDVSAAAEVTSYRIFTESKHGELCLLMDCAFDHNEPEYIEFLNLIDLNQCDAAVTLLANNSFKVYPTSKCNNWQDDKMPSA